MSALFWILVFLLFYILVGYPMLLLALVKLIGKKTVFGDAVPYAVDFIIPAHNEAADIKEKIENTLSLGNETGHKISVIVVSDGSEDDTVQNAKAVADQRVKVLETPGRVGKLKALNLALKSAAGDIIVFSDANSFLSDQSLESITRHFMDQNVGGVCGQITVDATSSGQIGKAESLFWRYDQALKLAESKLGGTVSAQGSIYAIRRALTAPVPEGYADDFLMSVRVVDEGYRLVFDPMVSTVEKVTEKAGQEMDRRIRSTIMGWRGLMTMAHLMNPFKTGLYGWQLFSHKFLRRLMPFLLILLLVSNLFVLGQGWFYILSFVGQVLAYGLAGVAYFLPFVRSLPLVNKLLFFVMGNLAMAVGLWRYYSGERISLWTPVRDNDG